MLRKITGLFFALLVSFLFAKHTFAATIVWDGGGVTNNWSEDANWAGDSKPSTNDLATFNGTSTKNAVIDQTFNIQRLVMNAGYTGTITQNADLGLSLRFEHTTTDGTFTWASGTLSFNGASGTGGRWDVDSDDTFGDVTIDRSSGATVTLFDSIPVSGTLTLTNGRLQDGEINLTGNLVHGAAADTGTTSINMIGSTAHAVTLIGGGGLPTLNVTNPNVTISGPATGMVEMEGLFTLDGGATYTGSAGALNLREGFVVANSSVFTAPADLILNGSAGSFPISTANSGTFNHNNGRVVVGCSGGMRLDNDITFYDFWDTCTSGDYDTIAAGMTMTVLHNFFFYTSASVRYIQSDTPGIPAYIDAPGNRFNFNVGFTDIEVLGDRLVCPGICEDGGGSTNIRFNEPGYIITPITGNTSEAGGTATFTVALRGEPIADVAIPVSSTDVTEGTVSPSTLTFTSMNYATPQTVTVTGIDDVANDGGVSYDILLGMPTTSADPIYAALEPRDLSTVNIDNDDPDGTIGFDDPSLFNVEDVSDTASPAAVWFTAGDGVTADFGFATILDGDDGTPVDLEAVGSKIQPGCTIVVSGNSYYIHSFNDYATTGSNVTVTDGRLNPVDFANSVVLDAPVDGIYCSLITGDGYTLNRNDILVEQRSVALPDSGTGFVSTQLYFASIEQRLWWGNIMLPEIYAVDVVVPSVTSIATNGLSAESGQNFVADPAHDAMYFLDANGDAVLKINSNTMDYYNGDQVSSTFPTAQPTPVSIAYDSTRDDIWVGNFRSDNVLDQPSLMHMDADGTQLGDLTLGSENQVMLLYYEEGEEAIWAINSERDSLTNLYTLYLYKINAATGDFFTGVKETSRMFLPLPSGSSRGMFYDGTRDVLWVIDGTNTGANTATLIAIDPHNLEVEYMYPLASATASQVQPDAGFDIFYIADEEGHLINKIDPDDGSILEAYTLGQRPMNLAIDAEGDFWSVETKIDKANAVENLRNGVPYNQYYSMTTTDDSQLDVSAEDTIDSLAVIEDDDGEDLYYTFSFNDRHTFSTYNAGWRPVASDLAAVHGGTNGVWYYRDNASGWTVAPGGSPDASRALSSAMAFGNNQMTGAEMSALDESDWGSAGGFDSGTTTTLDVGISAQTTDPRDPPITDEVSFNFMGGGGATPGVTITLTGGTTVVTEGGATDTYSVVLDTLPASNVTITVTGNADASVSPTSLIFTNVNGTTPQVVTVTAVDDGADETSPETVSITHSAASADADYNGISIASVSVDVIDNDASGGGGGGGGSGATFVDLPGDDVSSSAISAPACSATGAVSVLLSARNATQYQVSTDGTFDTETWKAFSANVDNGADAIPTMRVSVALPEIDASYTVSVRFRSSTGNISPTITAPVERDVAGGCSDVTPEEPEVTPEEPEETPETPTTPSIPAGEEAGCFGILHPSSTSRAVIGTGTSPVTGESESVQQLLPGDYFRSANLDTVYCVDADMHRRPFIDEITYFTHERTFDGVIWVTDATVSSLQLGAPILPKVGVALVKFATSPQVYRAVQDPDDADGVMLRALESEEIARENYGDNWADYVIDVNDALYNQFTFGAPITDDEPESLSKFRARRLLNEISSHIEQGIVNFTRRIMNAF